MRHSPIDTALISTLRGDRNVLSRRRDPCRVSGIRGARRFAFSVLAFVGIGFSAADLSATDAHDEPSSGRDRQVRAEKGDDSDRRVTPQKAEKNGGERARRERWRSLPPEKRRQLKKLHHRLKELPPNQRRQLIHRLRGLDATQRRAAIRAAKQSVGESWIDRQSRKQRRLMLKNTLSPEVREELRRLPQPERRKRLREILGPQRQQTLNSLPPEIAEKIRRLPPEKRPRQIERHKTTLVLRQTLRPEEIRRLRRVQQREWRRLFQAQAKPEYFSENSWRQWQALQPVDRLRILRRVAGGRNPSKNGGASSRRRTPRIAPANGEPHDAPTREQHRARDQNRARDQK